MQNSLVETVVGAVVVLVALVFLGFGYLSTSQTPNRGGYVYKAIFDSIDGISLNSDVKIGGVRVGAVSSIDFDEHYRVVVTMCLKKEFKIPDDSSVSISSSGFIGDKFIAINPGASQDSLENGSTFIYAKPALNLESLINKVISAFVHKNDKV